MRGEAADGGYSGFCKRAFSFKLGAIWPPPVVRGYRCAQEEQGDGSGTGVGANDRTNIAQFDLGGMHALLHHASDQLRVSSASPWLMKTICPLGLTAVFSILSTRVRRGLAAAGVFSMAIRCPASSMQHGL